MGLLDRLVDFLGGGSDASAGPPGGSRDPEDPPRDHVTRQRHGSHWDAVVPSAERKTTIQRLLALAVEKGDTVAGEARDGAAVRGHQFADGPLGVLAVTVDGEVVTGYPVGDGADHAVEVTGRQEWETGVEAWVHGETSGAALTTFATNYYAHPGERFGGRHTAAVAGFLYDLGPAPDKTVVDADGDSFVVDHDFAGFTPWESGAVDDYVVRTVPEAVDRVTLAGLEVDRVEAPLFRTADGETVEAVFYAGTHLGDDYDPAVGEPFQAPAWLQARVG